MQRLARLTVTLLPALLATVFVFHFAMTLLYLTPPNPIKLRYDVINQTYMLPFFAQNWHLFAPNPANDNRILMVSCRVRGDDGAITTKDWSDISSPLRAMYHQNRFSPADRLDRLQSATARTVFQADPILEQLKEHRTEEDSQINQLITKREEQRNLEKTQSITILNRIASSHCDRLYGGGRTTEVRLRMALLTFPRFSQRHLPNEKGELRYFMFDWAPYERVTPMVTASSR